MRIDRFGLVYSTAYQLSQNNMEDSWHISRPAVYARVGGLPGAFDYYGDNGFPFEPFTVSKKMVLVVDAYIDNWVIKGDVDLLLENAVAALRAATIAVDVESKLWMLRRDGTTRWAWAKCTRLSVPENYNTDASLTATVEFFCREGVWHT